MKAADLPLINRDTLLIGVCGRRAERLKAIDLCRQFNGTVLFREGSAMVIEIEIQADAVSTLLAELPRKGVTHLWHSGMGLVLCETSARHELRFCGT